MSFEDGNCSMWDIAMSGPLTPHTGLSHAVLSSAHKLMAEFDQKMNHIFSGGDPTVAQWFLVRETYLPFLLCGCYTIFCTLIGPALMRNRKPFDLRGVMIIFNFGVVAVYACLLFMVSIYFRRISWYEFCIHAVVKEGEANYKLAAIGWTAYLLKYVEFLDTVFFVLRKKTKQLTFLHVFHHTIVPIMAWALLRTETTGIQSVPAILNSCVHVIMYSYYGLAAMGPSVQKYLWWKKYLTQLQIVQFILVLLFAMVVAPLMGCTMVMVTRVVIMGSVSAFLYLFYQFYRSTFKQKED